VVIDHWEGTARGSLAKQNKERAGGAAPIGSEKICLTHVTDGQEAVKRVFGPWGRRSDQTKSLLVQRETEHDGRCLPKGKKDSTIKTEKISRALINRVTGHGRMTEEIILLLAGRFQEGG